MIKGPIQKQIILHKLIEALENAPNFMGQPILDADNPHRQWLAEVGALLSRLGTGRKVDFQMAFEDCEKYWGSAIRNIKGQILDAIEEIKLDLELDGRGDIGNSYGPGEIYRFFADLKTIINHAEQEIMVVDPYFNGEAFDAYLSTVTPGLVIHILADRYLKDINSYVEKHKKQYQTDIELRRSKELHDRLVFIDQDAAWIMGSSIKDAGKKASYLIPVAAPIAAAKRKIYKEIWDRSVKLATP